MFVCVTVWLSVWRNTPVKNSLFLDTLFWPINSIWPAFEKKAIMLPPGIHWGHGKLSWGPALSLSDRDVFSFWEVVWGMSGKLAMFLADRRIPST